MQQPKLVEVFLPQAPAVEFFDLNNASVGVIEEKTRVLDIVAAGTPGSDGEDGTDGSPGNDGVDGRTILNGTGAPGAGLGADDDFYLDTAATRLYGPKTAGEWGVGVSLLGGPGQDGDNGTDGVDGRTILNGTGAPGAGLGADDDFYLDTAATRLYGPKTAGEWGVGVLLIGAAGADGSRGSPGGDSELFTYDNSTTEADLGNGEIRFNNAALANVTEIYVDNLNSSLADITGWLDTLDDSTSTAKGVLVFRRVSAATANWARFRLNAITAQSGYYEFSVTYIDHAGAFTTTANNLLMTFMPKGDKGDIGDAGADAVVNKGTAILNFGAFSYFTKTSVLDSSITDETKVLVSLGAPTAGRDADELEFSQIIVAAVVIDGVGFDIYATSPNGADGTFNVNYFI